jgi:hypothetical protein
MDIDHTKMSMSLPQSCYWCGQPGHISKDCPNWFDIYLMTTDKQDEFVERIMASSDMSTTAAREAIQASERSVIEWEVSEEDFVRSE